MFSAHEGDRRDLTQRLDHLRPSDVAGINDGIDAAATR